MLAEFYVTDGTDYINFLSRGKSGFSLKAWDATVVQSKGGGVFQDSPLAHGRRLVFRRLNNSVEQILLAVQSSSQDAAIALTQDLRRLMEKAVAYWTSQWQQTPVYLVVRAHMETNARYALIYDYRTPRDTSPFISPFANPDTAVFNDLVLLIERGNWLENPPGEATCVQVSGQGSYYQKESFFPTAGTDDAHISEPGNTISTVGTSLLFGDSLTAEHDLGVRFRNVTIPPGSTIVSAYVKFIASANQSNTALNSNVVGEDTDSAAAFSTYADFTGRTRTTATVAWDGLSAWTTGDVNSTPDISSVIQEIVDRGGWASGNDLVVFVENDASTAAAYREAASFENATYTPPELVIVYQEATVGRAATCEDEVFIANKRNDANITDAFYYDASAGTYSANLIGATLPFNLLPTVPAAGDILYLICDTSLANSGPFCSAIFDIGTAQTGITVVAYEYWDGATWANVALFDLIDNTSSGGTAAFEITGVNGIHWQQPTDWATTTVNGVTGLALRVRVVSISGIPTPPTQQNRGIYSVTWPYIDIQAAQVGGDLSALAYARILNQSAIQASADKIIMGARSVIRGAAFTAYLNCADEQNPSGVTVTPSTSSAFTPRVETAVGRVVRYTPGGVESMATRVIIDLDQTINPDFVGRYRVLARVEQNNGSLGDFSVRLQVGYSSSTTPFYTSDTRTLTTLDPEVVDFGYVSVPPLQNVITSDIYEQFTFLLGASAAASGGTLDFFDLILVPADEWIGEFVNTSGDARTALGVFTTARYLEVDSIKHPKQDVVALIRDESGDEVLGLWQPITNAPFALQSNAQQRLWFLAIAVEGSDFASYHEMSYTVQVERNQNYLAMRGAN